MNFYIKIKILFPYLLWVKHDVCYCVTGCKYGLIDIQTPLINDATPFLDRPIASIRSIRHC